MEGESLYLKAKAVCSTLVTGCKALSENVEVKCSEQKLVELIKKVASTALEVSSIVNEHIEGRSPELREKAELQENFLAEYTKSLRETVITLVRHTRDFYANPLDFMTKQSVNNSLKDVAVKVKALIDASRSLDEVDGIGEIPASPKQHDDPTSPREEPGSPTSQDTEEADKIGNTVSEQSEILIKNMDMISDAVPNQDADSFNKAQKVIATAINLINQSLQGIPNTENALNGLMEATFSYITAAKAFFKSPDGEAYAKNYTDTQREFSAALKQLIFQVSRRNRLVGRSLSRGFSKRSLTQNLRNSVLSGGANRLQREASIKGTIPTISTSDSSGALAIIDTSKPSVEKMTDKKTEKPIIQKSIETTSEKSTPEKPTSEKPAPEEATSEKSTTSPEKPVTELSPVAKPVLTKVASNKSSLPRRLSESPEPLSVKAPKEDQIESQDQLVTSDNVDSGDRSLSIPAKEEEATSPFKAKTDEKRAQLKSSKGSKVDLQDAGKAISSKELKKEKEKQKEKEKEKEKEKKKEKQKEKDKDKKKLKRDDLEDSSASSERKPRTNSSSTMVVVTSTRDSPKRSRSNKDNSERGISGSEADSPVPSRLLKRDITTSSEDQSEDTSTPIKDKSSTSDSLLLVPKGASLKRINSTELLGEISQRQARMEYAQTEPSSSDDDGIIDDSRDEDEDDLRSSGPRLRAVRPVSFGPGQIQPLQAVQQKKVDNDKQQICARIIASFCERFPAFKAEWEAADPMKRLLTENKIVSELAMYHITILQSHPGETSNNPAVPKTVAEMKLSTAASSSSAPSTPTSASAPVKLSKKEGKEKSSTNLTASTSVPTSPVPAKKTPKKSTTPASLRLWSDDKDKPKEGAGKEKRSPRSQGSTEEKDDSAQIDNELQRIATMKTSADLGGMTMRLKGGLKSLMGKTATPKTTQLTKLPENSMEISQEFCRSLLEFLALAHTSTREPLKYEGELGNQLQDVQKSMMASLRILVANIRTLACIPAGITAGASVLNDLLVRVEDEVSVRTGVLEEIDSKLMKECQYSKLAIENIEISIYRWCSGLYYTAAQIITDFSALSKVSELDAEVEATILHLLALLGSFANNLTMLMNDLITLHYLVTNAGGDTKTLPSPRAPVVTGKFWDEPLEQVGINSKDVGIFRTGTLNQLILRLLCEPHEGFIETFIDTFSSFTTASVLIDKLFEASQIPKGKFDKEKQTKIMSQICDVLGRLIKVGFKYDFDDQCIPKCRRLLGELAKTVDIGIQVQQLILLIKQKEEEERAQEPIYQDLPKEVQLFEGDSLPHSFLLAFDASVLAQQLTFIEFDIYKHITAEELKNQSWNKPKRMCIARNVVAMIQRANRISLWVATLVLLQPKVKDRARIVLKIINVAKSLKELNNYNTLMGIIAGLNMSCVSRLKQTMAAVGRRPLDNLKHLQAIVDPSSSFKTLRETLRHGGNTQLPYIGTTLTDLTFIEDGNPDNLENPETSQEVINMEKRQLLSNCIRSVRAYQNSDYKITVRDPPYTFLHELPSLSEQVLYALSLEREPRVTDSMRKKQ